MRYARRMEDSLHRLLRTWHRVGPLIEADSNEPAHWAAAQRVAIAVMDACDAAHLDRVAALYHGELRQR